MTGKLINDVPADQYGVWCRHSKHIIPNPISAPEHALSLAAALIAAARYVQEKNRV